MNPLLSRLQPYPFEKLRALTAGVRPNPAYTAISLGIGEPRHPTPDLIKRALINHLDGLSHYPPTAGSVELRQVCAAWAGRRYGVTLDAVTQVLPVNGSREALFALAQVVVDPTRAHATVVSPNPFYQIYEGAALLAGAQCHFAPVDTARNFAVDWEAVPEHVWQRTQLLYVCSPGNPTGAVMPLAEWARLFELSDRHGFVIASDECYSEIWFGDAPPLGGLEAAVQLGRGDFRRLVMFTSLSKRSNVPGLRSGFVAGDADVLKAFLQYRTYHGSAMGPAVQAASIAAWNDEAHVQANHPCIATSSPVFYPSCNQRWMCANLTPVSTCGPRRRTMMSHSRAACSKTTIARFCPAVFWLANRAATIQAEAASVWPWWPKPTPASKPPSGSSPMHAVFEFQFDADQPKPSTP